MTCSLYAIEFTGGLFKVGRAIDPVRRIAQHQGRVSVAGLQIVNSAHRPCAGDVVAAERRLIGQCAAAAAGRKKAEWFTGLTFGEVLSWLEAALAASTTAVAAAAHDDPSPNRAFHGYRLVLRRDSYPCPEPGGYICRSCCIFHFGDVSHSAFLCAACHRAGYEFRSDGLTLHGESVPLWSGVPYSSVDVAEVTCVSCEEMRPEMPWIRIPDSDWTLGRPALDVARIADKSWPHPKGRPVLDVSKAAA